MVLTTVRNYEILLAWFQPTSNMHTIFLGVPYLQDIPNNIVLIEIASASLGAKRLFESNVDRLNKLVIHHVFEPWVCHSKGRQVFHHWFLLKSRKKNA